jgi:hypothetical protein
MEKISNIVRGSPRVASTDLKSAAPVRPGAPSFGRPVGESTEGSGKSSSTASRAVALHNANVEMKRAASEERVIQKMADDFFMSRIRRPAEEVSIPTIEAAPAANIISAPQDELIASPIIDEGEDVTVQPTPQQPPGYTPRGSYVDVRA